MVYFFPEGTCCLAPSAAACACVTSLYAAGQGKRMFRPGNPELMVNAILGMLIWVHEWYRPERHKEEDIGAVFGQLLAGGLLTASSAGETAPQSSRTRSSARKARVGALDA